MDHSGQITKIYIINLKKSTERREEMIRKMEAAGLEYEFYEAVDGQEISPDKLQEIQTQPYSFKNAFGREMTLGEIGCAMSHLNLYKKIIEDDHEFILVLEDDIDFDSRLGLVINNNRTREVLRNKFDLILLGYSADGINYRRAAEASLFRRQKISHHISFAIPTVWNWSTIGYFISTSGAKKLIAAGQLPRMPADFLTANSPKYGVRLGISNMPIVWPGELDRFSHIGGGRGHPREIQSNDRINLNNPFQRSKSEEEISILRQVYSNTRKHYHKCKKKLYNQYIKLIPSYYLYISDRL